MTQHDDLSRRDEPRPDHEPTADEPAPAGPTGPTPAPPGAGGPRPAGPDEQAPAPEATDPEATEPEGPTEPEDPLEALERERDDYLDALRRKQAEFENFRKRMMREGASQRIAGHAEVAERMLDVLDDFDRTLEAAVGAQSQGRAEVDPGFLKGVQLVHDKLVRVLDDFGLQRIDDAGAPFDPNRHEAVQQVSADQERDEPHVNQVLRPGYELGGRVLRAAMVVVEQ